MAQSLFPVLSKISAQGHLGGNKCRLVAWINYAYATVYVRFIGTHRQYDDIDADSV